LKAIAEEDYIKTLNSIAEKKYETLKGEQYLMRKKKTADYLLQKGYESALVSKVIKRLTEKEK
jgi:regulatory protein